MIGLLFPWLIIAAVLAEKTKEKHYNSIQKTNIADYRSIIYYDYTGSPRYAVTDEKVLIHSINNIRMYYSLKTGKLLYDEGDEILHCYNQFCRDKGMRGHYGFIDEYMQGVRHPVSRKLFYFDDMNRPYILFMIRPEYTTEKINTNYCCYLCHFKGDLVPFELQRSDNNRYVLEDYIDRYNIDANSMIIIPTNEIHFYDLDKA